jgi:MFS family permease
VSGAAWSGFTLSTANFLYDLRPHRTGFAAYAAAQASITAAAVFVGGLAGGFLAASAPRLVELMPRWLAPSRPLFLVFVTSAALRVLVIAWFIPRAHEPQVRRRPEGLKLIYRISKFSALSGVSLDWLTVTRRSAMPSTAGAVKPPRLRGLRYSRALIWQFLRRPGR